ncbi:MAG: mucoidy inhibitor MuiA family protein [Bacteroidetes bacterium]|nr:MAG: mucoidy inhibitor MuiA family protein [Bacteroidota bacterium]MBL1143769.1 mucoidy inhibitor MuiA family protein [Bacteroidota bacterium]NOG56570.1 mucoidy inhibitor MuiA family protein [Bacteroidota bacterium]
MKNLFLQILILLGLSTYASIDTTTLKSEIKDVTIFFSGAEITRVGNINLKKGKHIILIDKLPQGIYPQSIQVKAIPNASILSVKQENAFFNAQNNSEIGNIEKKIESETVKIQRLKNKIKVLEIEERFLLDNSRLAGKDKGVTVEDLRAASSYYNSRLTILRDEVIDLELEIKEIKEQITEQYKSINKIIHVNKQAYTKVYVAIDCETNIADVLSLSYYTPIAGWVPTYDFRVKEITDPLKIVYNANVFQSTGESWEKVNITLSSNNPSLSGDKPELQKWILGKENTYLDRNNPTLSNIEMPMYGGNSTIKGKVSEGENGEPIPFANVSLFRNNEPVLGTTTDFDGQYSLKPVEPGTYSLEVSYVGYQSTLITNLMVVQGKISTQNVEMRPGFQLNEVQVVDYKKPLFENDQTTVGTTVTREELQSMAVRSQYDIGKTAGNGVFSRDDGYSDFNSRGSRTHSSSIFIDGVKTNNLIDNQITNKVLNLEYKIKIPYTIPSDGKDYNLKIKEIDLPVDYEYFIVPKLDNDAFLAAHLKDWEELDLLSGKASIYFKGTYTSESYINVDQVEDTLTLSLGRDKNILVNREENKKIDEKRFYSNDVKETIAWDITIKNNKSVPVYITVEDQYPTSNRKAFEVELISAPEAKNDKDSGELRWTFTLEPQAKKELEFKYEVKYPKYMNLRVR